jgi:ribonuclease PH
MEDKERAPDTLRPVRIIRNYLKTAEGSALIEMGDTKVLCAATITDKVPSFLRGTGEGWITAEYSLLPRSTSERSPRESRMGRLEGRSVEISRMIGRALRMAVDREKLGEHTIIIDCDVIQADGGTRTAAITGGFCALYDAIKFMLNNKMISQDPIREFIAAVSVGIVDGEPILDLSYDEDVRAEVDLNVAMTESGKIVEIQGTAEKRALSREELNKLLDLAWKGIKELIEVQKKVLL